MIRRLHPCFMPDGAAFFLCPYVKKKGTCGKNYRKFRENHSLLWKYYGLCLRGVAHLCNVTNTEGYGNNNDGQ